MTQSIKITMNYEIYYHKLYVFSLYVILLIISMFNFNISYYIYIAIIVNYVNMSRYIFLYS